jgi:hypothetical protein
MNLLHRARLLLLLALVTLGILATAVAPVGATSIYVDPNQRFAIGVADGWTQQTPDTDGVVALWSVDGGRAIFNIVRERVPYGTSNEAYARSNIDGVSSFSGYTEIRRDYVTCADQDCPILDYTAYDDNGELQRVQQVFVTQGSDGYVLTYRTRASDAERYRSDVELMVYSFSL